MATIKFTTNLISSSSKPWKFNPNELNAIPNKPGVYIVGVKIDINGQGEKFCPLIVGQSTNLKNRITGHRDPDNTSTSRGELNSFKEIFNFEVLHKNPSNFYEDIKIWDEGWISKHHKKRTDLKILCESIKLNHNSLIWFPNPIFYDVYFGVASNININVALNRHNATIQKRNNLTDISSQNAKDLINKINKARTQINDNYFIAYAYSNSEMNEDVDFKNVVLREEIESATKWKLLNHLKISTYAGINGAGKNIWSKLETGQNINLDLDLSAIQNDLVNLGGHTFGSPNYNSPLIL
jgi:hypothetical protein